MTNIDKRILKEIEKEDWRREHPGWLPDMVLRISFEIAMILIGLLIIYWSSCRQMTEVEAAVFHKETETILYVPKAPSTWNEMPEFLPEAIEVDNSSPSDAEAEIEVENPTTIDVPEERWESLGRWKLSAYCPESCCNGRGRAWKTASGAPMVVGDTVATARLPFGTKLKIRDQIYTVTDRGVPYGQVDILHESHSAANNFGIQYAEVFILRK